MSQALLELIASLTPAEARDPKNQSTLYQLFAIGEMMSYPDRDASEYVETTLTNMRHKNPRQAAIDCCFFVDNIEVCQFAGPDRELGSALARLQEMEAALKARMGATQ